MGEVYLARDEAPAGELGEVVVKLLGAAERAIDARRFLTEARAARALATPHVVKIYDFGFEEDGQPYLVMERLRGITLRELLVRRGRFLPVEAVSVAQQVAEAMIEVHEAGIVHRDLKPENLMLVDPDHSFVKVLDFGAARLGGDEATQSFIGTPRYMAPEQLRQEELDGRADIYALGACIFEMMAGQPAFPGGTLVECMEQHLKGAVPRLRGAVDVAPLELDTLVTRMLAKARGDRPATMAEVRAALSAVGSTTARTVRLRNVVVLSVLLLLGVAGAGVVFRWSATSRTVPPTGDQGSAAVPTTATEGPPTAKLDGGQGGHRDGSVTRVDRHAGRGYGRAVRRHSGPDGGTMEWKKVNRLKALERDR